MTRMMTTVWYGPPGVGKSTFISKLMSLRDDIAFDLESLPSTAERRAFVRNLNPGLYQHIGAADTRPSDFPPGFNHVLVLPTRRAYLARRVTRDLNVPAKRGQPDSYYAFEAARASFTRVVSDFPYLETHSPWDCDDGWAAPSDGTCTLSDIAVTFWGTPFYHEARALARSMYDF